MMLITALIITITHRGFCVFIKRQNQTAMVISVDSLAATECNSQGFAVSNNIVTLYFFYEENITTRIVCHWYM